MSTRPNPAASRATAAGLAGAVVCMAAALLGAPSLVLWALTAVTFAFLIGAAVLVVL
jgi:hypothetical protein